MACLLFYYAQHKLNPNRPLDCYALMKPSFWASFSSLLGYNGTPLRPQSCKTSVEKYGYYHHNANDRFGLKRKGMHKSFLLKRKEMHKSFLLKRKSVIFALVKVK